MQLLLFLSFYYVVVGIVFGAFGVVGIIIVELSPLWSYCHHEAITIVELKQNGFDLKDVRDGFLRYKPLVTKEA
ncbi:hypothetical protein F8M41_001992 [Gigaspora margarita]|uniref:Uncharacterized protein n=1 Tax=Gigaspora margarita TaxID=4874 RepID=A0A8H3XE94_GIGMA|nr:hypothetical protein F8M41_001992 [Gigaspora margarita]